MANPASAAAGSVDDLPGQFPGGNAHQVGEAGLETQAAELIATVGNPRTRLAGHVVAGEVIVGIRDRRECAGVPLLDRIAEENRSPDAMLRGKELILQSDRLID